MPAGAWTLERHRRLPSTNDRAKALAREGAPGRTVVVAGEQTEGRGRGAHTWSSPVGGLYVSVLLREVPVVVAPLLSLVSGVAMLEAVREWFPALRLWLKWPNDLLAGPPDAEAPHGKAGGILVEASGSGQGLDWVVLGCGLNVSPEAGGLPGGLDPPAVSLAALSGQRVTPDDVLRTLLDRLDVVLDRYAGAPARVTADVEPWLAYRGQWVDVVPRGGAAVLTGRLLGLADDGALRLGVGADERRVEAWDAAALRPRR